MPTIVSPHFWPVLLGLAAGGSYLASGGQVEVKVGRLKLHIGQTWRRRDRPRSRRRDKSR
jgi:hypothetical protein